MSSADDDRVWVGIFNRGTDGTAEAPRPVFEAVAVFGESIPAAPPAAAWSLDECRVPASSRPSRSMTSNGCFMARCSRPSPTWAILPRTGIEGRLRVLPLEPLVKSGQDRVFHTDLIVIDNFTQLLGAWGLDYLAEGDVMFPLRMEDLEIYGDRPAVGTRGRMPITIDELERHRIRVRCPVHPARWDGLDADQRLGGLAVPLAGPLPRCVPPAS